MSKTKSSPIFLGVIVAAATKQAALNSYKLAALNKGSMVYTAPGVNPGEDIAFVSLNSSGMEYFNPMTAEIDIEANPKLLDNLEFTSTSSVSIDTDGVNIQFCSTSSGCGGVTVSDEPVHFCPICSQSLSVSSSSDPDSEDEEQEDDSFDLDDEESEDEVDDGTEPDDDEESEDAESEDEESEDAESEDAESEDAESEDEEQEVDGDPLVIAATSLSHAVKIFAKEKSTTHTQVEVKRDDAFANLKSVSRAHGVDLKPAHVMRGMSKSSANKVILSGTLEDVRECLLAVYGTSISASHPNLFASNYDTHYMLCTNSDCEAHVLSEVKVHECPSCSSALEEPDDVESGEFEVDTDEPLDADLYAEDEDSDTSDFNLGVSNSGSNATCDDGSDCEDDDGSDTDDFEFESDDNEVEAVYDPIESLSSVSSNITCVYCAGLSKPAWLAFADNETPVGILHRENMSTSNASLFDKPNFGATVATVVKQVGAKKALLDLGFKPFKTVVSVSAAAESLAADLVAVANNKAKATVDAFNSDFEAALATAAVGINKKAWTGLNNPIQDRLVQTLQSIGIANASALVQNAFIEESEAYHRMLLSQASSIMSKPADVRDELAKIVGNLAYQRPEPGNTGLNSISAAARLGSLGDDASISTSSSKTDATAEVKPNVIDFTGIVASLGRR
jgi:hypothetical protein